MRAVLDPNVILSALLSKDGAPARLIEAWARGAFELVVSPLLLAELERALEYPKLRRRTDEGTAARVIAWLERSASIAEDPADPPPLSSRDPGDDYLIALAAAERAALVSGDSHLLELAGDLPVFSPSRFAELIEE